MPPRRVTRQLLKHEAVCQVGLIVQCMYPPNGKWYPAEIREWDQTSDKYFVVYVEDNIGRWLKREHVRAEKERALSLADESTVDDGPDFQKSVKQTTVSEQLPDSSNCGTKTNSTENCYLHNNSNDKQTDSIRGNKPVKETLNKNDAIDLKERIVSNHIDDCHKPNDLIDSNTSIKGINSQNDHNLVLKDQFSSSQTKNRPSHNSIVNSSSITLSSSNPKATSLQKCVLQTKPVTSEKHVDENDSGLTDCSIDSSLKARSGRSNPNPNTSNVSVVEFEAAFSDLLTDLDDSRRLGLEYQDLDLIEEPECSPDSVDNMASSVGEDTQTVNTSVSSGGGSKVTTLLLLDLVDHYNINSPSKIISSDLDLSSQNKVHVKPTSESDSPQSIPDSPQSGHNSVILNSRQSTRSESDSKSRNDSFTDDFLEEDFSDRDSNYDPFECSDYINDSVSETEDWDDFLPEKSLMTKVHFNRATTSSCDSDAVSEIIPVAQCSVLTVSACDSTSSVKNFETSNSLGVPIETRNTKLTSSTTDITIECTNNAVHRKYDKYSFCYFCKQKRCNLSRHLVSMHSGEDEVQSLIKEKNKEKRNILLMRLRNLGNHLNNCQVLKQGKGQLIVKYRPTNQNCVSHNDYAPCKYCYAYFAKKSLWKHTCPFLPKEKNAVRVRKMSRTPPLNEDYQNLTSLTSCMRLDNVGKTAISDHLILQYGSHILRKLSGDKELYSYVRGKMRHLASLVIACRQITGENLTLSELLVPDKFDTVLKAVTHISGFDNSKHTYKLPSNAVKSGQVLRKATELKMSKCAEKGQTSEVEKCSLFLKVLDVRWTEISSSAIRNLNDRKRNVIQLLPLTEDVSKLNCHLNKLANSLVETLKVNADPQSYFELIQVLLTKVILFNRKRQGEVSKMKIMDWNSRSKANATEDMLEGLSDLEKKLIQIMDRIEIRGKKGRTVAVLITTEINDWMLFSMDHRSTYVAQTNDFLFPRNSEDSHYRGSDTLRKFAVESCTDKPHLLTSTKLRKHVASMAQVLCLRSNELDMLANFMGHDIRIHTNFYRKPLDVLQVARVAKVFLAAEQGQISQYSGKNLEEIEIGESIEEESKSDVDEDDDATVIFPNATQLPGKEGRVFSEQLMDQASHVHERKESIVSPVPQKRRKCNPVPWTAQEKESVHNYFAAEIMSKTLPGKERITQFLVCEGIERPWKKVKDFLRNNFMK